MSAFSQTVNLSLNVPFMHQMLDSSGVFPTASRAPNKALFTISARTSRILVANKFACEVFGYQQSELVDAKIQRLFSEPYQSKQRALVEQHINSDGDTVLLSGKVVSVSVSTHVCAYIYTYIYVLNLLDLHTYTCTTDLRRCPHHT